MDQPFTVPGYRLVGLLGFGGTGEVWRAIHEPTGQPVALKRLWEPAGPELIARLKSEAIVLDETAGEHAVAIYDIKPLAGGEVALVFEYAAAGSLATLLANRPQLRAPEVVTILGPLARALAAAHATGLVHGDVTPSNVVFTADGRPKLSDFGLAIATGERRSDDPVYRDPALQGGTPTAASDVFGLAAIGYAALTGVPPRPADVMGRVRPITELAPDVPTALASAVEAAMASDPQARPDAAAFAAAVLRSSGADPIRFTEPPRTTVPPAARTAHAGSARRGLTVVVAGSIGLAALTGAGWVKLGQRPAAAVPAPLPAPIATATSAPVSASTQPNHRAVPGPGYRGVVAHLLALRDQAFDTAQLRLLAAIYAKGSDGWQVDAAAIRVLRSQRLHARGFKERLVSVAVHDQTANTADLMVTTQVTAYAVVDHAGRVVARRPGRVQRFRLTLRHDARRWLVQSLSAAT
ncbi:MAG TPA: serine/threonine-protein kinase [Mycobacteriales bacterium]|nr:serine/threonine-protein kinase [Mycobacteriales bacterium]